MKLKIVCLVLLSSALSYFIVAGCAQTSRRLNLDQVGNLTLNDLVHPEIMKSLGVKRKTLPAKERFESELEKIYLDFLAHAEEYERPVSRSMLSRLRVIKFVDSLSRGDAPGVVATCNRYFLKYRTADGGTKMKHWSEIEVHREKAGAFEDGVYLRFKMLVYHELFHCLYNRGHLSEGYGIMSETLLKMDDLHEQKWLGMVRNMFTYQFDRTPVIPDGQ